MRIFGSRVSRGMPSYGNFWPERPVGFEFVACDACCVALLCAAQVPAVAQDRPVKIVALGDSLTAGFGLPASERFPPNSRAALKAKGIEVEIVNAGVSGDTATGGLERLDWSVLTGHRRA